MMSEMQSASSQFEGWNLFYTKTEGFLRELVSDVLQPLSLTLNKARPCKRIQDRLGFWIPRHGFRIPGTTYPIHPQWNLDFGFLVSKTRIPDSKANFNRFRDPDFLIRDDKVDTSALTRLQISVKLVWPSLCKEDIIKKRMWVHGMACLCSRFVLRQQQLGCSCVF